MDVFIFQEAVYMESLKTEEHELVSEEECSAASGHA